MFFMSEKANLKNRCFSRLFRRNVPETPCMFVAQNMRIAEFLWNAQFKKLKDLLEGKKLGCELYVYK